MREGGGRREGSVKGGEVGREGVGRRHVVGAKQRMKEWGWEGRRQGGREGGRVGGTYLVEVGIEDLDPVDGVLDRLSVQADSVLHHLEREGRRGGGRENRTRHRNMSIRDVHQTGHHWNLTRERKPRRCFTCRCFLSSPA